MDTTDNNTRVAEKEEEEKSFVEEALGWVIFGLVLVTAVIAGKKMSELI